MEFVCYHFLIVLPCLSCCFFSCISLYVSLGYRIPYTMRTFNHIQRNHKWLTKWYCNMIRHLVLNLMYKTKTKRNPKECGIHLSLKMTKTRWKVHDVRNWKWKRWIWGMMRNEWGTRWNWKSFLGDNEYGGLNPIHPEALKITHSQAASGHASANATGEVKVDNTAVADSKTLDLVIRPTGLISKDGTIWATWDVVCPARRGQTK